MTKEEVGKVFSLLAQFYPRAKQLQSKECLAAWRLVLERFSYCDVKAAVVDYAARNKFFPDVADLTANLETEAALLARRKAILKLIAEEEPQ